MTGTRFSLEVQPTIPEPLERLPELANDLMYSWDRGVRSLFFRLDRKVWEACGHNPKVFLRRVSQERLERAAHDRGFIEDYNRVLTSYDIYHREGMRSEMEPILDSERDLIGYFCAEYGFHESFSIYSGGLGILAGDHCKAASDLGIPFVAVGLLYSKGYFTQTIDSHGNQIAHYTTNRFEDLPIEPARTPDGEELRVSIALPGRSVRLRVWEAKAGHIKLYLLDSSLTENREDDRAITHQLYGGGHETRIQQEIILGVGGVLALRALGLEPTVWHINEGHAAFQILERCRESMSDGMSFDEALELVAAGTVFTTHTPVPAGHDIFDHDLFCKYFRPYADQMKLSEEQLHALGAYPGGGRSFNMTALALRGSRFHNGVSRIHGSVASRMESYIWPQIAPEENPISYVTNGVHLPTFLAREWVNLFDMRFSDWRNEVMNPVFWEQIETIPDLRFWSLRQELKSVTLSYVRERIVEQHRRNGVNETTINRIVRWLDPEQADTLVLGFARRFATYKRATLIFRDPERLARMLSDESRPVVIIIAGKAHPHDAPGQQLIRDIHELSMRPEFIGKIIVIEGYDMALARKLVTGVDVWLNTPAYPLEASGTSGQKAAANGAPNLSVLDGWWGEGYDGDNGWAITPHDPDVDPDQRDHEESGDLLDILEQEVIPLYYDRDHQGYPPGWVRLAKNAMTSILPRFNSLRMVRDYVRDFYGPARDQQQRLAMDNGALARELAGWKRKVREQWPGTRLKLTREAGREIQHGELLPLSVTANLNGLAVEDVAVECLVGTEDERGTFQVHSQQLLEATDPAATAEVEFTVQLTPPLSGLQYYKLRMYPYHKALSHPFETGCMIWL